MTLPVLDDARQFAESLMLDTGELRGPDVRGALNESTQQYTYTPGALKYSGKCKIQLRVSATGASPVAGDRAMAVLRYEVHLPMSTAAAAVDDWFKVTASVSDPELVGRRFRVAALVHKTHMSARRLICEEVQN